MGLLPPALQRVFFSLLDVPAEHFPNPRCVLERLWRRAGEGPLVAQLFEQIPCRGLEALDVCRGHLCAPVPHPGRNGQPRLLRSFPGVGQVHLCLALSETDHGIIVGDAEELTKPVAFSLRVLDEVFVERLVVETWTERRAVLSRLAYLSLPPQRRGRDGVLLPGRVAPDDSLGFFPIQDGNTHIAAVADDVDELRVGPEGVECRDASDVGGGLVAHQRFVLNFSVQAEDPSEEGWVWESLPRAEQAFELFPGD